MPATGDCTELLVRLVPPFRHSADLSAIAERLAPALLLLLGRSSRQLFGLDIRHSSLRLTIPGQITGPETRKVLPVVAGTLVALSQDPDRRADSLLPVPGLVRYAARGQMAVIPRLRPDGTAVLDQGRRTLLAVPGSDHVVWVYAQELLTCLYLYAEAEIAAIAAPGTLPGLRSAVLGRRPLPDTMAPAGRAARRTPSAASRRQQPPAASHRLANARTIHRADDRLTMTVLLAGDLNAVTRWVAKCAARHTALNVLVSRWSQVRLSDDGARVDGRVWAVDPGDGALVPTRIPPTAVQCLYYAGAGDDRPPSSDPELAALRRLDRLTPTPLPRGLGRRQVIHQLLLEASRRGVVTNTNASLYPFWDAKHGLEFTLRRYGRLTGRDVRRPQTVSCVFAQVPLVLGALGREGADCIVKPTDGGRGRGLQVVPHGGSWSAASSSSRYVVQELVRDPLLLDGRKLDLRCHVLIDADSRARSGWVPPILARHGQTPYRRGTHDSENLNFSYRPSHAPRSRIAPLDDYAEFAPSLRQAISAEAKRISAELTASYFACRRRRADGRPLVRNRVFLWGLDVGLTSAHDGVRALLLENNVRPQLLRGEPGCDAAMAGLITSFHVPAMLSSYAHARCRR
ncbi:MAG: hypothetical protein ACLQDY_16910 [Streptosporangiaceae bacterium]